MNTHASTSRTAMKQRRDSSFIAGLLGLLCCTSSLVPFVQADRTTQESTQTQVARWLETPPTIDGVIEPTEWERAGGKGNYWVVTPDGRSWVSDGLRGGTLGVGDLPADGDDLSFVIYAGYDSNYLYVAVSVKDSVTSVDSAEAGSVNGNTWEDDSVEVFVDAFNGNAANWGGATGDDKVGGQYVITANNAYRENEAGNPGYGATAAWFAKTALITGGYEAEFRIALTNLGSPKVGDIIGFDIAVNDDDGNSEGGISPRKNQVTWAGVAHQPITYGNLKLGADTYTAPKVTTAPVVDGIIKPNEYGDAATIPVDAHIGVVFVAGGDNNLPTTDLNYTFQVVHDANAVYIGVNVVDDVLSSNTVDEQIAAGQTHESGFHTWDDDSVEIFFDLDNSKRLAGSDNAVLPEGVFEGQYTLTPFNTQYNGSPSDKATNGFQWFGKAVTNANGYSIEFKIPKTSLGIKQDNVSVGFHVAINDDDIVGDYSHVGWIGHAHQEYTYGTLTLAAGATGAPFRIVESKRDATTGNLQIRWEGGSPPFQVEKAASVAGPYQPVGATQTERVFTDSGVIKNSKQSFYRIRH